jgi:hypothetical protein
MSQPRPTESIEMEMGFVVIIGERGAPNDFLFRVKLSRQACNIAILVPEATVIKTFKPLYQLSFHRWAEKPTPKMF